MTELEKQLLAVMRECDEAMAYMSEYDIPLTLPDRVKEAIAAAEAAQPDGAASGLTQVDMGFGKFAVGGCVHPETRVPGIAYLHLRGDIRPIGADTTDVYPVGMEAQPNDIAGLIYFHNAFAIQQTIEVLLEMQHEYYPVQKSAATQPVAVPEGWQLVPIEPTEQMWDAGRDPIMFRELGHFRHGKEIPAWQIGTDGTVETDKSKGTTAVHVWRAMIAAAPRSGE